MNESIDRCFFHELGHFVADQLNKDLFDHLGVEKLSIYPCEKNVLRYCGHITPIKPAGFDPKNSLPPPLKRLASYLASLMHGCIFQSYYLNDPDINSCLSNNGGCDVNYFRGTLYDYRVYDLSPFFAIHDSYYLELRGHRRLDGFLSLSPMEFLKLEKSGEYFADIAKLSSAIQPLLEEYKSDYVQFVTEYQGLVDCYIR